MTKYAAPTKLLSDPLLAPVSIDPLTMAELTWHQMEVSEYGQHLPRGEIKGTAYSTSRGILVLWDADGTNSSYRLSEWIDVFLGSDADEEVFGFEGGDTLRGEGGQDYLDGGAGDDWLYGGSGNDVLVGGEGKDRLEDGSGSDRVYSGEDDDVLVGTSDGNIDIFDGGGGVDLFVGGDGDDVIDLGRGYRQESGLIYDLLRNIEKFDGGGGNDTILGTSGNDQIEGGDGADTIYGFDGNDTLGGGDLDDGDVLYGGEGNDELTLFTQGYGGEGDDVLSAGREMTGGAGHDRFVIVGENVITDFTPGEDVLDFMPLGHNYHRQFGSSAELLHAMHDTAEGLYISFDVVWPDGDVEFSFLLLQGVHRGDILPGDIWW
ncbi:MAG: calcium-binding protein [Aestuariivirga sp.]